MYACNACNACNACMHACVLDVICIVGGEGGMQRVICVPSLLTAIDLTTQDLHCQHNKNIY